MMKINNNLHEQFKQTISVEFDKPSDKQAKLLSWWCRNSPYKNADIVIAHGSIRSGKSFAMGIGFIKWAMMQHSNKWFGICGKTIGSIRKNVIYDLHKMVKSWGWEIQEKLNENLFYIKNNLNGNINLFELFGGNDESSYKLIQGRTFAGLLLDEITLMPESFVNQAIGRCSVKNSKIWMNCNPDNPFHYIKTDFLDVYREKRILVLHFVMEDNPSLSRKIIERYKRMFAGTFYKRYILGQWVVAEGIVFDMFCEKNIMLRANMPHCFQDYYLSIDYGTNNPFAVGLYGILHNIDYKLSEYVYDSKKENKQKTDGEYATEIKNFLRKNKIDKIKIIVDPSALSFINELKKQGYSVMPAKNDVADGIRELGVRLYERRLYISEQCVNTIKEFNTYRWDEKASSRGEDKVIKKNDHNMDETRYYIMTRKLSRVFGDGEIFEGIEMERII